jgi:hypothetical protein
MWVASWFLSFGDLSPERAVLSLRGCNGSAALPVVLVHLWTGLRSQAHRLLGWTQLLRHLYERCLADLSAAECLRNILVCTERVGKRSCLYLVLTCWECVLSEIGLYCLYQSYL